MLLLFARCADFIDVVPENSTTFTSFFSNGERCRGFAELVEISGTKNGVEPNL